MNHKPPAGNGRGLAYGIAQNSEKITFIENVKSRERQWMLAFTKFLVCLKFQYEGRGPMLWKKKLAEICTAFFGKSAEICSALFACSLKPVREAAVRGNVAVQFRLGRIYEVARNEAEAAL